MASSDVQGISQQPQTVKLAKTDGSQAESSALPSTTNNSGSRSTQHGIFARLQSLLPPSFSSSNSSHHVQTLADVPKSANASPPKFLKTRIVTWNMHDSLPKGNLEEILGSVPIYTPRTFQNDEERLALPALTLDETHPYHILVIAGQECPTLSGIPMGLAANFKHWDLREREKEKHKEGDPEDSEKSKHRERNILHRAESLIHKHLKHEIAGHFKSSEDVSDDTVHSPTTTSGWSAVLEDWYANGMGAFHGLKPVVTTSAPSATPDSIGTPPVNSNSTTPELSAPKRPGTIDVNWRKESSPNSNSEGGATTSSTNVRKGPYELLVKERLMGIYMAVYVHRDVRPLIRGFSSDSVPAGLIGGRLGNKGGVGISVNFNGTTLLFINGHLAAHEGKAQLRVANLSKIKAELSLDSFLSADDPRMVSEDLTDRFDHTFIFGDLNFRLDISRLHADWLIITKKEYSKALAFDQLKQLMAKKDPAFLNFHEGEIKFAPTFKYDVLPRKKSHKKILKPGLDEEAEDSESRKSATSKRMEDEDALSVMSSIQSSRRSEDGPGDESGESSPANDTRRPKKLFTHTVFKAKTAWFSLLSPANKIRKRSPRFRPRHTTHERLPDSDRPLSVSAPELGHSGPSSAVTPSTPSGNGDLHAFKDVSSQDGPLTDSMRGVYDSSTKQRVPSWCDRILWKTTIKQPPEEPVSLGKQSPDISRSSRIPNRGIGQMISGFRKNSKEEPPSPKRKSFGLFKTMSLESGASIISTENTVAASSEFVGGAKVRRQRSLPSGSQPRPRFMRSPRRSESDGTSPIEKSPTNAPSPSHSTNAFGAPKRWFLSMMSREPSSLPGPSEQLATPSPSQHRKGDVVCINYRTLDDRQMRRLDGRSDHRPVIGSYAIYL